MADFQNCMLYRIFTEKRGKQKKSRVAFAQIVVATKNYKENSFKILALKDFQYSSCNFLKFIISIYKSFPFKVSVINVTSDNDGAFGESTFTH